MNRSGVQLTSRQLSRAWPLLVVFITLVANASILVCQQVAIRILAPVIGSSVETWSAILGVFLLGIALGNFIAGRFADRLPAEWLMSASLLLGAVTVFLMHPLVLALESSGILAGLPLSAQIIIASLAVCLLPGIALSMITPPSIRSLVQSADQAGAISGRVFAWGTLGSLLGNYLTGFVLLAMFGTDSIIQATWLVLLLFSGLTLLVPSGSRLSADSVPATPRFDTEPAATAGMKRTPSTLSAEGDSIAWTWRAIAIVFTCSFASGALESAAFRIFAPLVGVSMFLTAGVVGVILTGMATGNWLGGVLAARRSKLTSLRNSLLFASLSISAIVMIWAFINEQNLFRDLTMIPKVLAWSFSLFMLPALLLGTITPQVIGLSVRDVGRTGRIAGQLYGWSTVGCIFGILASGWLLIEMFGALRTCIICGALPLILLWLISSLESNPEARVTVGITFALAATSLVLFSSYRSPYDRESKYFAISVIEATEDGRKLQCLKLDYLLHSCIDLNDPTFLYYKHEQIQADLTRAAAAQARSEGHTPRILVIGGGGYSYPRWVEAQPDLQDVIIEVVEIDPAVTEIAHSRLGLSRETRIRSIHMDGRQYVKGADKASYDLVIQDAVNDLSVPYHLMTAEYATEIRKLLRPERLYLLTLIDNFDDGKLLASTVRTTESVFGPANLLLPTAREPDSRDVYVIACRNHSEAQAGGAVFFTADETACLQASTYSVPRAETESLLERNRALSPLLTDNYAPVDSLMAGQYLRRGNRK